MFHSTNSANEIPAPPLKLPTNRLSPCPWSGLFTAISEERPENLDWSLFAEQTCYILSDKILVSDMLAIRYPRGTAGRAVSVAPRKLARTLILILGTLGLNFAGQGCDHQKSSAGPSIEFTHIPPAVHGGRGRIDKVAGRVRNAHLSKQVVIYAHSGTWWVRPWPPYLGS